MPSSPSTRKLTSEEQIVLQTLAADELFSPLATARRFGFYALVTGLPILWLLTIIRPLRPARPYVVGAIVLAWIVYGIRDYFGSARQRDYELKGRALCEP